MKDIIKSENLTFRYNTGESGGKTALSEVNVSVHDGEYLAILGHNGSGKSSLAKHFNAVLLPCGGRVLVDGMDTLDEELLFEIRRTCGMVFQNPDNQIVATITEEDVAFGPENLGLPREEIRKRVDDALKTVGMYEYRDHAPHLLSGGQKQRIAIAGIIAMRPRCIVLDEPTSMLDPSGRRDVLRITRELNKNHGITIVLITHHMNEAAMADRIIIMDRGKQVLEGTPKEIFPQTKLLHKLGLAVPQTVELLSELNRAGFDFPLDKISVEECADAIAEALKPQKGEHLKTSHLELTEVSRKVNAVMSIRGLSHVYSPKTPFECSAVNDINLDIYPGETLGIIGHTGSGKSTLISHLNGLIKPSSGSITYCGEDIFKSKEFTHSIRFNVGLVLQYPEYQLFEETVYKDIAFGPGNMKLPAPEIDERVREAARFAGLDELLLECSPFELSGGQKRRVAIAGVIAMRPKVLILDEPTAGLDPVGREDLLRHIRAYRDETGAAIVIVSHSMEDVASMADRLLVMSGGRVLLQGTPDEVFSHSEILLDAGLDIPQVAHIANALRARGIQLPDAIYTVKQAVSAITAPGGGSK